MRYIKNIQVRFDKNSAARQFAQLAGILVVDNDGAYVSTAHFLCGDNPWGLHQDMHFGMPLSRVRLGLRIVEAAEKALKANAKHIELEDQLYEAVLHTLAKPNRAQTELPMPPSLAREILPITDAIENATTSIEEEADSN